LTKTIAVLGGGIDSIGILRRIKEMGLRTIVFDGDENAPAREHLADTFVNVSCYDAWAVMNALCDLPEEIHAVLCAGTDCPDVMAVISGKPSMRTAEISMNKWMQKKIFLEAGVRIPSWIAGEEARGLVTFADVVVKPTKNRGSRGVSRVRAGESLDEAIKRAASYDSAGHVIVEDWIDGIQLSSESLVQDGKIIYTAYSQRNYSRLHETYPYVIEDGGDMPPYIPLYYENDHERMAHEQLQKCVDALGLRSGTLKGDLVWDGNKIWVIEVACRLSGGDFCSKQIPTVWGVDFVGFAVRLALGETIYSGEIDPYFRRYMCQRFVIPHGTTHHAERGPSFIRYGKTRSEARGNAQKDVKDAT